MKLHKSIIRAFKMVMHSKLRSWLTIIGIVIGVASVISIVALGAGMQASLESQMGDFGTDLITLTPGYSRSGGFTGGGRMRDLEVPTTLSQEDEPKLTKKDLMILNTISDIDELSPQISGRVDVTHMGEEGSLTLTGINPLVFSTFINSNIYQGRPLGPSDNNVVVIGKTLATSYFEKEISINKIININGNSYRVVGILDDDSRSIYMPLKMAFNVIEDKEIDAYDSIIIKVKNEDNVEVILDNIDSKLLISRHVTLKTKDFTLTSNQAMQETRAEMMNSLSLFLTAIAAVSLLVGAVGIANTMFTSVLEKTKEIGIMKAIGAKNSDILTIFLFNAGFIGLSGGILGVLLGYVVSGLIPKFITLPMSRGASTIALVSPQIVLTALLVSIIVGMIAGVIPAYQASRLKPVDALRYE